MTENDMNKCDLVDVTSEQKIEVEYSGGVKVNFGNELTPLSVKDEPTVHWTFEEGQYYTLVMTDPDAPSSSHPFFASIKHWMIVNIPENDMNKGETLAQYIGSAPPKGTGLHRYIFLVYKQSGYLKHSERVASTNRDRTHFKVRKFAHKYNLGQPVATNYFRAQSDDYSRDLWARRGRESFRGRMEKIGLGLFRLFFS